MRALRIGGAVVLLALALVALLTAVDVGRWRDRLDAGDRATRVNPQADVAWKPATLVPFDAAGRIVGLGDDIALRRAIHAFVVARHTGEGFDNGDERSRRTETAQSALEQIVLSGSPVQAAQANVLLGVLEFSRTQAPQGVTDPAQASVDAFTQAARSDPSDVAAKFDLELVLRAISPTGTRSTSQPSAGSRGKGNKGAGAGLPGNGF